MEGFDNRIAVIRWHPPEPPQGLQKGVDDARSSDSKQEEPTELEDLLEPTETSDEDEDYSAYLDGKPENPKRQQEVCIAIDNLRTSIAWMLC